MIRSTYRNLMIGLLIVSFGIAFYLFRLSQDIQVQISERENDITRLNQELENAQSLNVALTELDNLTITEQTATQLDILRHLGLEQSELGFTLESREIQAVGSTNLYTHNVRIIGALPYEQALTLCDRLQNTKKIVINGIEIGASVDGLSTNVVLNLTGKIYGLDKTLTTPAPDVPPLAMETSTTSVSPTGPTGPIGMDPSATTVSTTTITVSTTTISTTTITQVSGTTPLPTSPTTAMEAPQ